MGNTSSAHKITAQDKAILDMKTQRDKLHQYQRKITSLTARETAIAKDLLRRGDKQRALLALRRKKYQETLLSRTDAQLAQLEQLVADVEFAAVQKDVLFGLQQGTSVLKEIHKEIGGIERVEMLLGESDEERAYQREISEMLSQQISVQEEEEIEEELEGLEKEVLGRKEEMPSAPEVEPLPGVPAGEVEGGKQQAQIREGRQKILA